jgi:hypothetical protein
MTDTTPTEFTPVPRPTEVTVDVTGNRYDVLLYALHLYAESCDADANEEQEMVEPDTTMIEVLRQSAGDARAMAWEIDPDAQLAVPATDTATDA